MQEHNHALYNVAQTIYPQKKVPVIHIAEGPIDTPCNSVPENDDQDTGSKKAFFSLFSSLHSQTQLKLLYKQCLN